MINIIIGAALGYFVAPWLIRVIQERRAG